MKMPPVAIAGIGCLCGAGLTLKQCMTSMYAGIRQPALPTRFSLDHTCTFPVFEVTDDFFPAEKIRNRNVLRTCKLALTATLEALGNARLEPEMLQNLNTGVCIGTNVGCSMNNDALYRDVGEISDAYLSPLDRFLRSNPTSSIATEFKLSGPCQTVVTACSAGSDALGIAASWINSGLCDAVIAGGADELYRVTYKGFRSLFINDPSPCKPFDAHRNGLNLGEGAAIFIMVSDQVMERSGLVPRAFLLGYGSSADAYHFTKPRPDGKGLRLAIEQALQFGFVKPSELAFVNAHGTGTLDNDLIESQVLHAALPEIPFLSTKGYTGHTLGASGAIEAAFTIASLESGRIPASIGFNTPDPELPTHPVGENTIISGRKALSETLAFGGSNAVLIIESREGIT